MSNTYKSPYATSFKNAVTRGTSYNEAVWNIAKRASKTPAQIWSSLFKAGWCNRQKFNGQWIYWPNFDAKFTASTWKAGQFNMWQWFCEWCITSGWCTPEQFKRNAGSQAEFMAWCKKFFSKQFSASTPKAKSGTRKASTTRRPKAKATGRRRTAKATGRRTSTKRTTKRTAPKRTAKRTGRRSTSTTARKRTTKRSAPKRTAKRTGTRRTSSSRSSYTFPNSRKSSSSRRYSRAA